MGKVQPHGTLLWPKVPVLGGSGRLGPGSRGGPAGLWCGRVTGVTRGPARCRRAGGGRSAVCGLRGLLLGCGSFQQTE